MASMIKHVGFPVLLGFLLIAPAANPTLGQPITDQFQVVLTPTGQATGGIGTGYAGGEWFNYPNYNWWNVWFANSPLTLQAPKQIHVEFDVIPLLAGPNSIEVVYNWATPEWSAQGLGRPPLPIDVPNPLMEDMFIRRSGPPFFSGSIIGPAHVMHDFAIPDYCPEWISLDIRGFNVQIMGGIIVHECIAGPPSCEPAPDAQSCNPTLCPNANEICLPSKIRVFHNTPVPTYQIIACECMDPAHCHPELILPDQVFCSGNCPPNELCQMVVTNNSDGSIDYECVCVPMEIGACCDSQPPFGCMVTDPLNCQQFGRHYMGNGTDCADMNFNGIADICELFSQEADWGDAPESALAYPDIGVIGQFPTCLSAGPAGWIRHRNFGGMLGGIDLELEGNAGLCPQFNPDTYNQDECMQDGDAGLLIPQAFTIQGPVGGESIAPCPSGTGIPLGAPCTNAVWGTNVDIMVANLMPGASVGYMNVLFDWDHSGNWGVGSSCPTAAAPEHVLVNFQVPNGYTGPLSGVLPSPPPFMVGPNSGYVWARFTFSERQVTLPWTGEGNFEDGETEDYLLLVAEAMEACCLQDGTCMMATPVNCLMQFGAPQGPGSACTGIVEPCCLDNGECLMIERICCDELGGQPSPTGAAACTGDLNGNGIDDACEPPPTEDFGDAPDPPYPTLLASGGAQHTAGGLFLGNLVDPEANGQPNATATGDDLNGLADEDGVVFNTLPLIPGQVAVVTVTLGGPQIGVNLSAWVDFNGDGNWATPGDQIFVAQVVNPGPNVLTFPVPASATSNMTTFARFRLHTNPGGIPYTGAIPYGEVEDYTVRIGQLQPVIMACCLPDGTCEDTTYNNCTHQGGDPQGPGTGCLDGIQCHPLKWAQPPVFDVSSPHSECFWGWDEPSIYGGEQLVADDWRCIGPRPITNVHWWGSYAGWDGIDPPGDAPEQFHIGIWTDVPANPDVDPPTPSRPGTMIWQWTVDRDQLRERPVACDFHPQHMQSPEGCFRYDFVIPEEQWFWQPPTDAIYWISISAVYDDGLILCECDADVDGDGSVGIPDIARMQICLGQQATGACAGADMTCDGWVTDADIDPFNCSYTCTRFVPPPPLEWCQEYCCPRYREHAWGWKTRPHFFNDDAIAITAPNSPVLGSELLSGAVFSEDWDMAFVLTTTPPELEPKWSQTPALDVGFDAASDFWWNEPASLNKWVQPPEAQLSGLHAHDGYGVFSTLADDWQCLGGEVRDFEWWGNYELDEFGQEIRGSGIHHFHLSIHACASGVPWCLPQEPELRGYDIPFTSIVEVDTGVLNIEGSRIYKYHFNLPVPFIQETGNNYWLDLQAYATNPAIPAAWRWQEANRSPTFLGHAPGASRTEATAWQTIIWPGIPQRFSDFAFSISSFSSPPPIPEVNKVVADDFRSDGRPIEKIKWWGSYLDERYAPGPSIDPVHVVDGWFISFHPTAPEAQPACPPNLSSGTMPSALGVYFAPTDAIQLVATEFMDCMQHPIFEYTVDLDRCCLLCSSVDPRTGLTPAQPGAFSETSNIVYWLDIQAVTGVKWLPLACSYEDRIPTGHVPSDLTPDGHFWGWHTSQAANSPYPPMEEACTGRLLDMTPPQPYPPTCWQYAGWTKQPWMCPNPMPPFPPVHMAFELYAETCRTLGDVNRDGILSIADVPCFVECLLGNPAMGCMCGCANMNLDRKVDGQDIQPFVDALIGP